MNLLKKLVTVTPYREKDIKYLLDYDFFVPKGFLNDLRSLLYLKMTTIDGKNYKVHNMNKWFTGITNLEYLHFLYQLVDSYNTEKPVDLYSMEIIKSLSKTHNLKLLEQGNIVKDSLCLDNITYKPKWLNKESLTIIVEEHSVDYELLPKIIKLFNTISNSLKSEEKQVKFKAIKTLKNIVKAKKHNLLMSNLLIKFFNGNLMGFHSTNKNKLKPLYLILDNSSSMVEDSKFINTVFCAISMLDNPIFLDYENNLIKLYSKQEKIDFFFKEIKFKSLILDFNELIERVYNKYKDIIIVTDCEDYIHCKSYRSKLNLITNAYNPAWFEFIKYNNGIYAKI